MSARPRSERLRIVLVHRYFAPDTPPYAAILHAIGRAMVERGHEVRVLTCQPSYRRNVVGRAPRRETLDGVEIVRWPVLDDRRSHSRKALNLGWFCLRLGLSWRQIRRADVVMAATTPPVAVALVCSLLARSAGAGFVYHKQDIWPEVTGRSGGWRGRVLDWLRVVDHHTERRASRVVVLSEDMSRTVLRRGPLDRGPVILNNFDPWTRPGGAHGHGRSAPPPARAPGLDLVFAGNLGRFQGLEHVAELIEQLRDDPRIRWHFFGDGPLAPRLAAMARDGAAVTMHGFQPPHVVSAFLADVADLGVVCLNAGVIDAAYPSKTMAYLGNGCPVLALIEQHSELAGMVRDERIGLSATPDDLAGVATELRGLAGDPRELDESRSRARAVYEERFGMERQLARWQAVLEDSGRHRRGSSPATGITDRTVAALGLVLTSPALLLAVLGIRLTSAGPVIHRATRAGIEGRPFTMYKLRTMHVAMAVDGRITAGRDPRVFPVGRWLRRTKLDELPQLVNVVRGEMALVGPRPEDVSIVRDHYDAMMRETLTVPPGLTSPGSLHYFAEEHDLPTDPGEAESLYLESLLPGKIALDLVFVRHRSASYRFQIVLRTALSVVGVRRPFTARAAWELTEARRYLLEATPR